MSFQKRKTSYRKGVTTTFLDEYPIPENGESFARIVIGRGGNVFEVELVDGTKCLAMLPTKFNKLIWMKRGDFVIISSTDIKFTTSAGKQNGVEAMIQHILKKDQINHLKKEGIWPSEWTDVDIPDVAEEVKEEEEHNEDSDFSIEENPNRRRFYVESDESSE